MVDRKVLWMLTLVVCTCLQTACGRSDLGEAEGDEDMSPASQFEVFEPGAPVAERDMGEPADVDDMLESGCDVGDASPDSDGDGIKDCEEERVGTDPLNADTDGDGLSDYEELLQGTDPLSPDTDQDGFTDGAEVTLGTSPVKRDTDDDGLDDLDEVVAGTDPLAPDTDGDGLSDREEVDRGTSPVERDTDGDGLDDRQEGSLGTDPLVQDSDRDGLLDGDEIARGTNPRSSDSDDDGLLDGDELVEGTDPLRADSDRDGIADGDELARQLDPLDPDSDQDGLTDGDELVFGTNPLDVDSDGDGLTDFDEFEFGTDPLDADSDDDGLLDDEERRFSFDPNNPSTYDDGILDVDRDLVTLCRARAARPTTILRSQAGNWSLGLPSEMNNPVFPRRVGSTHEPDVVYSASNVAGLTMSMPANVIATTEIDALNSLIGVASLAHERRYKTEKGEDVLLRGFDVTTSQARSVENLRNAYFYRLAAASPSGFDIFLPDTPRARKHTQWRVRMLFIDRATSDLLMLAVTPIDRYYKDDAAHYLMRALTTDGAISSYDSPPTTAAHFCKGTMPQEKAPEVEFYWVLDQSASTYSLRTMLRSSFDDIASGFDALHMDWRGGIANMSPNMEGRLREQSNHNALAGWSHEVNILKTELMEYVSNCRWLSPACSPTDTFGLYVGMKGLTFMSGMLSPPPQRVRPDASIGTIFLTDDEAGTVDELEDPSGRTYTSYEDIISYFGSFYSSRTRVLAWTPGSSCGRLTAQSYREMAKRTGGLMIPTCGALYRQHIFNEYAMLLAADASEAYRLKERPVPSTIRVFVAGQELDYSRTDGYVYVEESNSVVFYGPSRPSLSDPSTNVTGDEVLVLYVPVNG